MTTQFEILKNIYNQFDPFEPLTAGDEVYVDCSDVRGEENILRDVGRQITYADRITHQLYTGHRGAGQSEAQAATEKRDKALDALQEWLSDYLEIAKVGLEPEPQLLEALGVLQRSQA